MKQIDFDRLPIGTLIKTAGRVGTYFGREIKAGASYRGAPIIKLDETFHECCSDYGICRGLWIGPTWKVEVIGYTEPCNIEAFLKDNG